MQPRFSANLIAAYCVMFVSSGIAESGLLTLRNNPFSRPEIVNAPPPPPVAPVVVIPPEAIELDLTATLVSATSPMIFVDGELLTIGEKIEGFKLIAVMEGKAVFVRDGKKFAFAIDDGQPE